MDDDHFDLKLSFVLKTLVVSNGRLAANLAVDKSVVGRWLSGSVSPSTYNLSRLTQYLATQLPGFTLHD